MAGGAGIGIAYGTGMNKGEFTMKKLIIMLLCAVWVGTTARADVATEAPAKEWKAEVGGDYFTEYIFRGVEISSDEPLLVPHVMLGWKWFTATYYGYYSPLDLPGNESYYENDFTLDGTVALGKFSLTGGAIYYDYPDAKDGVDTWELYGIVAYDFPLLNPKLVFYYDIDQFKTGYGTLSVNHVFDLTKLLGLNDPMALTLTPSAALSLDFNNWSKAKQSNVDLNDVLLGISANWTITKNLSAHTGVQLSIPLGSLGDTGQGDELIGNVGVSYTF
jgi:hypothetical protein